MSAILELPADELAPVRARRFVSEALAGPRYGDVCDVALLLTSELVTNAFVHAASGIDVTVDIDADGVTIRVSDADTGPIGAGVSMAYDDLTEGGRGFLLVHQLAQAWGTEHRHGRKSVWFRLALTPVAGEPPPPPPPGPRQPPEQAPAEESARRLATLLLRSELDEVLDIEGRIGEVLDRVLDTLAARGALVRLTVGGGIEVARGDRKSSTDIVLSA